MSESCREWRGDLAAHAIGRLETERSAALTAHLDGCPACSAELAELRVVATALPATDARDLTAPNDPPAGLRDRVLDQLAWARAGERSRRRRRLSVVIGTIVAAAAALVGVLALGASLHGPGNDTKQVAFTVAPAGVDASAVLHSRDTGTEVKLAVSGLDDGDRYWVWLTGADGHRIGAGSFTANGHRITVDTMSGLSLGATRRVWVTEGENNHVVLDTGWSAQLAPAAKT